MPPVKPMLAKAVGDRVPAADTVPGGLVYEPKWDGFRCVVFRDGDEVVLGSRKERPLTRYFPEVVDAVREHLPPRCVVDGELVVPAGDRLDFEALLQRIHPADSRVRVLAEATPASFVAFDLLARDDEALLDEPFSRRRELLEAALADAGPPVHLTPVTADAARATDWFHRFEGAGLDGLVCKASDLPYRPDERLLLKVKHVRTADCVLAGFRWHKSGPVVGSLLLGLHDDAGTLQSIGVAASFPMARRRALVEELEPLRLAEGEEHPWLAWSGDAGDGSEQGRRTPTSAESSRWNAGKDLSFVPLRPERVCEVGYDAMEGSRLRHTGQFKRWRPDRDPGSCTFAQLDRPVRYDLGRVLAGEGA